MRLHRWLRPRTCAAIECHDRNREAAQGRFHQQTEEYRAIVARNYALLCVGATSPDFGPSMEAVARATAETGEEHHLPIAVDDVPSPTPEEATRSYERRVIHPHDQEHP